MIVFYWQGSVVDLTQGDPIVLDNLIVTGCIYVYGEKSLYILYTYLL